MGVSLRQINKAIENCSQCPRLVAWRENAGEEPPKRFAGQTYWSRGVPGFGDTKARLLVVGLAPAADGANRTGRVFTGDKSGEFLTDALFNQGFANQSQSVSKDDGLKLRDAYLSCVVRCAPPHNRPRAEERSNCLQYLVQEISALNPKVILALGHYAFDGIRRALCQLGHSAPAARFGHGQKIGIGPHTVICSYHPSPQNTSTNRLTPEMLLLVMKKARFAMEESIEQTPD